MKPYGNLVEQILKVLEEHKALTLYEIAEIMEIDRYAISSVVSRMRKPGKATPKRLYVHSWTRTQIGQRVYPRPLMAIGDLPDKVKPRSNKKKIRRESDVRKRLKFTMNSVFNMGLTRNQYMENAKCLKSLEQP